MQQISEFLIYKSMGSFVLGAFSLEKAGYAECKSLHGGFALDCSDHHPHCNDSKLLATSVA
jgi:hypothetical protein